MFSKINAIALLFILAGYLFSKLNAQNELEVFPKIKGTIGILHPIVTFTSEETTTNFKDYYIIGMPIDSNIWKK